MEQTETSNTLSPSLRLVHFTDLNSDLKEQVRVWRNHPEVNRWMLSQENISKKSHQIFIESLKTNRQKAYFLVELKGNPIGVIDFYDINLEEASTHYGYYLKPELIGSSLGVLLEFVVIEYAFTTLNMRSIIAETMPHNVRAQELHKRFGFQGGKMNSNDLQESHLTVEKWRVTKNLFSPIISRLIE